MTQFPFSKIKIAHALINRNNKRLINLQLWTNLFLVFERHISPQTFAPLLSLLHRGNFLKSSIPVSQSILNNFCMAIFQKN